MPIPRPPDPRNSPHSPPAVWVAGLLEVAGSPSWNLGGFPEASHKSPQTQTHATCAIPNKSNSHAWISTLYKSWDHLHLQNSLFKMINSLFCGGSPPSEHLKVRPSHPGNLLWQIGKVAFRFNGLETFKELLGELLSHHTSATGNLTNKKKNSGGVQFTQDDPRIPSIQ